VLWLKRCLLSSGGGLAMSRHCSGSCWWVSHDRDFVDSRCGEIDGVAVRSDGGAVSGPAVGVRAGFENRGSST
jgi:hypothetical protein